MFAFMLKLVWSHLNICSRQNKQTFAGQKFKGRKRDNGLRVMSGDFEP